MRHADLATNEDWIELHSTYKFIEGIEWSRQPLPKTVVVIPETLGLPEISSNTQHFRFPLPNDFHNWFGLGWVSKKIPGIGSDSGTCWALFQTLKFGKCFEIATDTVTLFPNWSYQDDRQNPCEQEFQTPRSHTLFVADVLILPWWSQSHQLTHKGDWDIALRCHTLLMTDVLIDGQIYFSAQERDRDRRREYGTQCGVPRQSTSDPADSRTHSRSSWSISFQRGEVTMWRGPLSILWTYGHLEDSQDSRTPKNLARGGQRNKIWTGSNLALGRGSANNCQMARQ